MQAISTCQLVPVFTAMIGGRILDQNGVVGVIVKLSINGLDDHTTAENGQVHGSHVELAGWAEGA